MESAQVVPVTLYFRVLTLILFSVSDIISKEILAS